MKTSSSNQSVLLVEDHQELAETVGAYLEACGYVVDYAADGLTAAHLAVTESYSVIVLDIQLLLDPARNPEASSIWIAGIRTSL